LEAKQSNEQLALPAISNKEAAPVITQGVEVPKPAPQSLENSDLSRKGEFRKIRTGGLFWRRDGGFTPS
jgi:hypothetical protein